MRIQIPLLVSNLKRHLLREDGQDLVEYALVAAVLSCCAIAAQKEFAEHLSETYHHLATTFGSLV